MPELPLVHRSSKVVRRAHTTRNRLRQPQEIVRVPRVDHLGIGLQRALSEKRVIDRATGEARGTGRFRDLNVLVLVERDQRHLVTDVAEKQHRLVATHAPWRGHAGQRGVDLSQAVRPRARVVLPEAQEQIDTWLVMFMVGVEGGHQHRRVKKRLHQSPPALWRLRCVRIVWSVSSVSAAVRGWPVRNTQTPRSFCSGVALRLGRKVSSSPCTTRSKVSPGESRSRSRTVLGTTMRPARSRLTVPRTIPFYHGACYWQMALSLAPGCGRQTAAADRENDETRRTRETGKPPIGPPRPTRAATHG